MAASMSPTSVRTRRVEHGQALQAGADAEQAPQSLGAVQPYGGQRRQLLEGGEVGLGVPLEHQPFDARAPGDGVADVRPRSAVGDQSREAGQVQGLRRRRAHGQVLELRREPQQR